MCAHMYTDTTHTHTIREGDSSSPAILTHCHHISPQESRWAHIQNTAAKKTLLLGTIKMATLNLFQIVSKQLKESTQVSLEDTHKQLDMVGGGCGSGSRKGGRVKQVLNCLTEGVNEAGL